MKKILFSAIPLIVAFSLGFWTKSALLDTASTKEPPEVAAPEKSPQIRSRDSTANRSRTKQTGKNEPKLETLIAQVEQMEDSSPDPTCLRTKLACAFADQDPDAGISWIKSLDPTGPHTQGAVIAFAIRLGVNGSDKWKNYLDELTSGTLRDTFLSSAVIGLARNDAVYAWREYQTVADSAWNRQVTDNQVFDRLAQANPESFWEIVQELKREHAGKENSIDYETKFFTYSVFKDKQAAVRVFDSVPDPDKRREYVDLYLKNLYQRELIDFGNAVAQENFKVKGKDRVLYDIANRMYPNDLGGSAKLAVAINDEELMQEITRRIRSHAQRQGPDVEEIINGILDGDD